MAFWGVAISSAVCVIGCSGRDSGGDSSGDSTNHLIPEQPVTDDEVALIDQLLLSKQGGGEATVNVKTSNAFSEHSSNLTDIEKIKRFNLGNDFFENPWVAGSASTSSRDGLGGLFNNNACQDCHIRDGRGHAPNVSATDNGKNFSSTLIKAVRTVLTDEEKDKILHSKMANVPDAALGGQLQHRAVLGVQPEVALRVSYAPEAVSFSDGEILELRRPTWHITNLYQDQGFIFAEDTAFSVRVAPSMTGLGLLALIPEADVLAHADAEDKNNDGISGKANWVWSIENQSVTLGRFGWRAGQPSLVEQTAGAFVNDMGLTSRLQLQENCQMHQMDCLQSPNGNGDSRHDYAYEVSDTILDAVGFYSAHLAVPERRSPTEDHIQKGQQLFLSSGCADCHTPKYVTGSHPDFPELSNQTILPYTDLLLHDMGSDLADFNTVNQPVSSDAPVEYLSTAQEWRTPALWGIGLAKTVNPEVTFLHDGRARTLMEAILWHGGEGEAAKQAVINMSEEERQQLIAFLEDL